MKVSISDYSEDKQDRDISVEISEDDVFSLDCTLAEVIKPALEKYRDFCDCIHVVSDEDVPPDIEQEDRWNYVLDKMIFAFGQVLNEKHIVYRDPLNKDIEEGLRLFGKYYTSLWT